MRPPQPCSSPYVNLETAYKINKYKTSGKKFKGPFPILLTWTSWSWTIWYLETPCADGSVRNELEDEAVGPGLYGTWKPLP
jgi:hypothetical protein